MTIEIGNRYGIKCYKTGHGYSYNAEIIATQKLFCEDYKYTLIVKEACGCTFTVGVVITAFYNSAIFQFPISKKYKLK